MGKDPIGGVQPIEYMFEAAGERDQRREAGGEQWEGKWGARQRCRKLLGDAAVICRSDEGPSPLCAKDDVVGLNADWAGTAAAAGDTR